MDVIKTEQEFKEQAARSSSLVVVHFLADSSNRCFDRVEKWSPMCKS